MTDPDPLLRPDPQPGESGGEDRALRPQALTEFIGQAEARANLRVFVESARRRGEAMGILGMFGSLGMAAGPAIGSWIAMKFGYNWMFISSSGFALLSIIVVMKMPETLLVRERFRWSLLKLKWKDIFEPRALPSAITMLLTAFSFGTILTLIPDLSKHLGIVNKGIFFSIFTISSLAVRLLAGKLSDIYGRVPILMAGCFLYGITMFLIGTGSQIWGFYLGSFIFGIAAGLSSPTIFAWTIDLADEKHRGRAMATMFIALEAGIGVGGVVAGYSHNNNPDNFIISFSISGLLALVAVVYLVWYSITNKKASP